MNIVVYVQTHSTTELIYYIIETLQESYIIEDIFKVCI